MSIPMAIVAVGAMISIVIGWSVPQTYSYHTELKNISYQLSRIADALSKIERREK